MNLSDKDTSTMIGGIHALTHIITCLCDRAVAESEVFDASPEVQEWKEENDPPTSAEEAEAFTNSLSEEGRTLHDKITGTVVEILRLFSTVELMARLVGENKNPGYQKWEEGVKHFLTVAGALQEGDLH
jgi:hypothetical protein